jgi:heavy metal efflux system protein
MGRLLPCVCPAVFGVAVMTGVLFIAEVNRRRHMVGTSIQESVIGAASARLVPNLMLILIALLGMMPAATAAGIGSDIQRPMAAVIVGGLISCLLIALVSRPGLYILVSRRRPPYKALAIHH